jgi:adenylate kinase
MGPPGSGKGTQAALLASTPGWVHVATGDLFRDNLRRGTELGKLAETYMSRGVYVPDDITVGMVRQRLPQIASGDRIIFDGFPRTVHQAEALDELLRENGRHVGRVLLIDCSRDELSGRLVKRGQGRSDDTPEVIRKRFDVYEEQTRPVIQHYEKHDVVRVIDGSGTVEDVHERIREAVGSASEVGKA